MYRALIAFAAIFCTLPLAAQTSMGSLPPTHFKDTSLLKPPAGAKIAIVEFEDLECSACAHASPIVKTAMDRYRIPRVHHDFLIPSHSWSRTAAIDARYLEDKVSPAAAESFRRDVFANQQLIAGVDDLQQFTRKWFQSHGQQLPFVVDPSGRCAAEVQADCTFGVRVGVFRTPTIVVVTAKRWIEVTDPTQLDAAVDRLQADMKSPARFDRN
ncbi:protein-disulfide isomerase [Granulicella aggregans]|uniref:Protein-disulfide isomerase n=1 Tax=Granulicella aggregans TaxID=474949 RepID=A0A7W7ZAG8_9BACT|nr:thioredoxin domain-containing protein [Granulicella aggregans]MBB5055766.1 protein-disulfide isomerase [Granulicella aggregans]